jgi:hypothetical protein
LVPTANIDTAKLHWNSVVGLAMAKYMCIGIKRIYLSAALEYYEYHAWRFRLHFSQNGQSSNTS